eukprot:385781-Pleurochrysis_carterae.AAC.1
MGWPSSMEARTRRTNDPASRPRLNNFTRTRASVDGRAARQACAQHARRRKRLSSQHHARNASAVQVVHR